MANPNAERLKELQQEVESLQKIVTKQQDNCSHQWGGAVSDPLKVMEDYGSRLVAQGSDVWCEPEGYREVQKPRWKRECSKCGKIEYTTEREYKNIDVGPKFK